MEQQVDQEMRAWLMICAMSKNPPGIFGRKKAEKELREHLEVLNQGDQQDFAERYVKLCLKSRSYGSTLMNLVPLSKDATVEKLRREIDIVTRDYPSYFGLDEACAALRRIMHEAVDRYVSGR